MNKALENLGNTVAEALEKGTLLTWDRPWQITGTINASTDKSYHGSNPILLAISSLSFKFNNRCFATFNQLAKIGASVRKGEKGTWLGFFSRVEKTKTNDNGQEEKTSFPIFKSFCVFNITQADNVPNEWIKKGEVLLCPSNMDDNIKNLSDILFKKIGNDNIQNDVFGAMACFSPKLDRISLPNASSFKSPKHWIATFAHEAIHWTGGDSRLKRGMFGLGRDSDEYSFEELVAETGAALLLAKFDIPSYEIQHAAYIVHWASKIRNHPNLFLKAVKKAEEAVSFLLDDSSFTKEEETSSAE